MKIVLMFLALLNFTAGSVLAISSQITFQGTLKQDGVPMNGNTNMQFSFVDGTGATIPGTSPIAIANVQVTNGLFAVQLPIAPTINWQAYQPYIQVSVAGQTLTPNQPLTSNLYSIVSQTVVNGAIGTAQIAPGAVTTAQLATGSVTTPQIAAGAVTTAQLATGSVTTPQIAAGAVTTAQLAAGSVTTSQIAAGAVTTNQIAAAAVTTAQLAAGSVTTAQLDPSVQLITVPSGMIAMFAGPCPSGWTRFSQLDNAFPRGGASFGAGGGSATAATGRGVIFGSGQGSGSAWASWMIGDPTLQDLPVSILPPYLTMVYCVKS